MEDTVFSVVEALEANGAAPTEGATMKGEQEITRPKSPPHKPPPCLTNTVHLCGLRDLAVRAFTVASKDAAIQAHKWALLNIGLASCWRISLTQESSGGVAGVMGAATAHHKSSVQAHGGVQLRPMSHASGLAQAGKQVTPAQALVYEVWTFGLRQQLSQLTQEEVNVGTEGGKGVEGAGEFGRLGLHECVGITDIGTAMSPMRIPARTGAANAAQAFACPDVLIMLNDAMANRADVLLGGRTHGPGMVRLGDHWVPRMDEGVIPQHGLPKTLPSIHMHCFVRGTELMAALTVKLKRVQHLEGLDTIGSRVGDGQRYPASGIEVAMSPYGMSGLLKSVRPSQVQAADGFMSPASNSAIDASGWGEVETGQIALPGVSGSARMCMSKMVVVEVDGDSRLYPVHRLVRLWPSPVALVPQLQNIWLDNAWLDLADGRGLGVVDSSREKEEQRDKCISTATVQQWYALLQSTVRGVHLRLPPRYLPPLQGYWVFAGIPQECLKLLVRDKPIKAQVDVPAAPLPTSSSLQSAANLSGHPGTGWQSVGEVVKEGQQPADAKILAAAVPAPQSAAATKKGQKRKAPSTVSQPTPTGATGAPAPANKRTKKGMPKATASAAATATTTIAEGQADTSARAGEIGGERELLLSGGGDAGKKTAKKTAPRKGKGAPKDATNNAFAPVAMAASNESTIGAVEAKEAGGGAPPETTANRTEGKHETAQKSEFMELMNIDPSSTARVDIDTNDLMDLGELQMDQITDLADFDGYFSSKNADGDRNGGLGDLGDLADFDFDASFDGLASTPRATEPGAELRRFDSQLANTSTSLDADLQPGDPAAQVDAEFIRTDAAALEAARKQEEARDEEILAKPMRMLPPVKRVLSVMNRRNCRDRGTSISHIVPSYHLSLSYGPARESLDVREAHKDDVIVVDDRTRSSDLTSEVALAGGTAAQLSVPAPVSMHAQRSSKEQGAMAQRVAAVKYHNRAGEDSTPGDIVAVKGVNAASKLMLPLYSVSKIWENSRNACIYAKCTRRSLLLCSRDGQQRLHEGVSKMLPFQHLMAHQLSTTCHDMILRPVLGAPNAPPVATSMQTVRSAMLVRSQLVKEGISAAAYLSLEHLMRAELGDDARVMLALDPLSLPPDPISVACTVSKILGALDTLVPGLPREMALLDLPSLLGYSAGSDIDEIAERLPVPSVVVGDPENNWIEVPPPTLRWWEKLPLEPYGNKKNVIYCVICGSGSATPCETEASMFFKELSCMYEAAHLGTHQPLDGKFIPLDEMPKTARGANCLPANVPTMYKDAIVSVKASKATGTVPTTHRPTPPFEEACLRVLRGLVKVDDQMAMSGASVDSKPLPVLYILEPDFATGNSWNQTLRMQNENGPQSPAKARAEWQRTLAKTIGTLAASNPRILDLVVQIVPVQRINIGRKMQWLLRDLALAVYSKGRVRPRIKAQDSMAHEVDDETHHFFSATTMSIKRKTKWERKLHEPLLTLPHPHIPGSQPTAPPADTSQGLKTKPDLAPMLHCCYVWADDGLCLGAAITDTTGEMLETFSALYAGSAGAGGGEESAWRRMLQRLWDCLENWIRVSYSANNPVRLVIGILGSPVDMARDLKHWQPMIEKARCGAPDTILCEAMVVQLGVVRSLQLLSSPSHDVRRDKMYAGTYDTWPLKADAPVTVSNPTSPASTGLDASWLFKCNKPFSFPPATPGLALPLASAVLLTPSTREEGLRTEKEASEAHARDSSLWPTVLDVSLHLHLPLNPAGTGAAADPSIRHQAAVAEVARAYSLLSWATAHPSYSTRQSALPIHFLVAKRLASAIRTACAHTP
jgi:hypothetical protein